MVLVNYSLPNKDSVLLGEKHDCEDRDRVKPTKFWMKSINQLPTSTEVGNIKKINLELW